MKKVLAIALLVLFGLPILSPLLAQTGRGEGAVPACCRRLGKHHCMQRDNAVRADDVATMEDRCPVVGHDVLLLQQWPAGTVGAALVGAQLIQQPGAVAQAESMRRIARERSRHKRGPPMSATA